MDGRWGLLFLLLQNHNLCPLYTICKLFELLKMFQQNFYREYFEMYCILVMWIFKTFVMDKPSKTIIENNLRYLRYYSHLFSQHCFNNKKQCTSRKKTKNAQPRLEPAPFERPIVV